MDSKERSKAREDTPFELKPIKIIEESCDFEYYLRMEVFITNL